MRNVALETNGSFKLKHKLEMEIHNLKTELKLKQK